MKSPKLAMGRKQTAFFRIVSIMLAIAPLWLMLAATTTSTLAQASDTSSSPPSWLHAFGSSGPGKNISNAIKVGPDQSLYVTSQFSLTADFGGSNLTSAGGADCFIAKYSRSGALQWVAQAGGAQDDAGWGVDLDAKGNVYLTGQFSTATFFSANQKDTKIALPASDSPGTGGMFVAKYTSAGTLLWVQAGFGTGGGRAVAVNPATGTVYVAAQISNIIVIFTSSDGTVYPVVGARDGAFMALAKYDTNGNFQWTQFGEGCCSDLVPTGVVVDARDNAYAAGWFYNSPYGAVFGGASGSFARLAGHYPGIDDSFLVKYDKDGNLQWANDIGGYTAKAGAVTRGPNGEITVVGNIGNINSGSPSEAQTIVSSQPPGNNINLGGGIFTDPGNIDEVVATYNSAGVLLRALRRGRSGDENATGAAYDSRDNLYVTGVAEKNGQPQLFVDEYSSKHLLWEAIADAGIWTGQWAATTPALAVDAAGSVFVANGYLMKAVFGTLTLNSTGASEAFVAELNTAFANQSADLLLRLYASPTTVKRGDLLTYTFPVWNRGPSVAYLESLKTQVPVGTTFDYVRISGTPGLGTCTTPPYGGTGPITCHDFSAMAANTTWTVRLTVKVTAPAGSVLTESGTATEVTPDPNPADATATVRTVVQ